MEELSNIMESCIYEFRNIEPAPGGNSDWFVDVECEDMEELVDIQNFLERYYGHTVSVQSARDNMSCERNGGDVRIWIQERDYE